MFSLNQKVSYPGHGIGTVAAIESKSIAGNAIDFFRINLENGPTVIVPVNKADALGVRAVEALTIETLQAKVKSAKPLEIAMTWNARYREYMDLIRTGQLDAIVQVYASLLQLRSDKVLSFGERKMLDLARGLLIQELAASTGQGNTEAETELVNAIEGA